MNITRDDWRKVAIESNKRFIEIELICSDKKEHQYRVEERVADINGHKLPSWNDVINREYEPWNSRSMVVDTSILSANEAAQKIIDYIKLKS